MIKVLITPLDWGLGHATRCIPIIRDLLERGVDVTIAGSGDSLSLLRKEFTKLKSIELPGYNVSYSGNRFMVLKLMLQFPRLMRVIGKEHLEVEKIVSREKIDLIISDNRYGCWSTKVPAIFITHQINIILPGWLKIFKHSVRRFNLKLIQKFSECWIPDYPGTHSLAGKLVRHEKSGLAGFRFIGNLSRLESVPATTPPELDFLVILSGPEPQRTLLENMLVQQLAHSDFRYFIVRGLVNGGKPLDANTPYADYMSTTELQTLMGKATCVISRSGYSTIMDLAKVGKKAIFIPTPGQTEQVYLAKRLMKMRIAFSMEQHEFDLKRAHTLSKDFIGFNFTQDRFVLLDEALDAALVPGPRELTIKR